MECRNQRVAGVCLEAELDIKRAYRSGGLRGVLECAIAGLVEVEGVDFLVIPGLRLSGGRNQALIVVSGSDG